MIEVRGEGVAESSAGSHEVVAGERGGVGSRHDARMGEQSTVGGVGLGRKDIESHACEVSGVEVGEGGVRVEEGTAGDVDEPGPGAHRSEHSVVNEGRLPDLITGDFDDGIDFGDAFEEPVGSVEGGEGRDGPVCRLPRCMRPYRRVSDVLARIRRDPTPFDALVLELGPLLDAVAHPAAPGTPCH
jgi:hypothetical protein